jgi:hypothetical protein
VSRSLSVEITECRESMRPALGVNETISETGISRFARQASRIHAHVKIAIAKVKTDWASHGFRKLAEKYCTALNRLPDRTLVLRGPMTGLAPRRLWSRECCETLQLPSFSFNSSLSVPKEGGEDDRNGAGVACLAVPRSCLLGAHWVPRDNQAWIQRSCGNAQPLKVVFLDVHWAA